MPLYDEAIAAATGLSEPDGVEVRMRRSVDVEVCNKVRARGHHR